MTPPSLQRAHTHRRPLAAIGVLFPFVIFVLHRVGAPYPVEIGVALLALLAHVERTRPLRSLVLVLGAVALSVPVLLVKPGNLARLYPFIVSLAAFSAFVASARGGGEILANFAEGFAHALTRLLGPRWGRRFTQMAPAKREKLRASLPIWVVGIGINTLILFIFLFVGSDGTWLAYAGFASYLLLFGLGIATIARVAIASRGGQRSAHAR